MWQSNRVETDIVGQCDMRKEGRDVLEEERRETDECDMELSLVH